MLKILSLHDFEGPAFGDIAAVGLIEGIVHYGTYDALQDEMQPFAKYLRGYPEVSVTQEILATRETAHTICAGELFLPVHDSVFKKIANVWRERGLSEAIRFSAAANPEQITYVAHWIATRLNWVLDLMDKGIYHRDVLPTSGNESIAEIVATRDWHASLVRCLSWHPHCARLAVAMRDDRIRIFSQGLLGVPVLRHSAQKSVCCLSWRPNAGRELAVACYSGVLVWTIELGAASNFLNQAILLKQRNHVPVRSMELGAASNLLSHAILLKQRNHVPVTSVAWHPQGDLLASCSPTDLNIIIWNVSKEEGIPLKRIGGGGICFTCWSTCGLRLFSASCRNIFRVWNTGVPTSWRAERWTVPQGRIATACFGPNLTLLFATTGDPATIFSLPLQDTIFDVKKATNNDMKIAMRLIDLTKVNFSSDDNDDYITVGGSIVSMEWDPTGKYLAILFQDSPVIALVKTNLSHLSRVVEAQASCLIKGFPGEVPNCINFYQKPTSWICLTIAWSSGRVQHFPIVENESKADTSTHSALLSQSARSSGLYRL